MASTDTANTNIFQRLQQLSQFQPATANLFADWTLDPGDVVTVQQGNKSYLMPIYQMNLDWKGQSMVEVQSTGSEQRPPLSELKRRSYAGGKRASEAEKTLIEHKAGIEKSDERLLLWATESQWSQMAADQVVTQKSQFEITADTISSTVTGVVAEQFSPTRSYAVGDVCKYGGRLWTFQAAHQGLWNPADVVDSVNLNGSLASHQSQITQTRNSISLVVDSNGNVTPASIVAAIDNTTGTSKVELSADHVNITGNTTLAGVLTVSGGNLVCKGEGPGARGTFEADTIEARYIDMDTDGIIDTTTLNANVIGNVGILSLDDGLEYAELTASNVVGLLSGASISNDTLTVSKLGGGSSFTISKSGNDLLISDGTSTITFSRAAKFSGAWNGAGVYSVTADPNGVTSLTVEPGLRLNGSGYSSSFSAQMGSDQLFTSVEKSSMGYLHQNGGYVGVYTNYNAGVYTGLIAQLPVADTSNADIVSVTGVSVSYNAAKKVNVTFTEDIGVKHPGGIDEVWASGRTATQVVNLDNVLEPIYQASISSTAQQIRPSSALGRVGLLGVNIPAVKLDAKTVTATSSGQTFNASDYSLNGFSSLTVNYASTYAHNMTINRKQTNVQKGNYYDTRFYRRNANGTINTSAYIDVTAGHSVYTSATDVGSSGKTVYYN